MSAGSTQSMIDTLLACPKSRFTGPDTPEPRDILLFIDTTKVRMRNDINKLTDGIE